MIWNKFSKEIREYFELNPEKFLHGDTARCIELAVGSVPDNSKVRIFNQVSEVRSVKELAEICVKSYGGNISYLENPRKELSENDLAVSNEGLKSLGLNPITLNESLVEDVRFIAEKMKDNLNPKNILSSPKW
jgi:UDP-sulfoquinovose synthase